MPAVYTPGDGRSGSNNNCAYGDIYDASTGQMEYFGGSVPTEQDMSAGQYDYYYDGMGGEYYTDASTGQTDAQGNCYYYYDAGPFDSTDMSTTYSNVAHNNMPFTPVYRSVGPRQQQTMYMLPYHEHYAQHTHNHTFTFT